MPRSKPVRHVQELHDTLAEAVAALAKLLKAPQLIDPEADEREEEAHDTPQR